MDIEDYHDNFNELTLKHNNDFYIHNYENIIEKLNRESVDIRSKQVTLNKHFVSISLIEIDEMEIDLFHLLKASNAPLILFDRIIAWIKRHEGNLIKIDLAV